jgi:hypothetical protein
MWENYVLFQVKSDYKTVLKDGILTWYQSNSLFRAYSNVLGMIPILVLEPGRSREQGAACPLQPNRIILLAKSRPRE